MVGSTYTPDWYNWKELWLASIATEMGWVTAAVWRAVSEPAVTSEKPVMAAPESAALYLQGSEAMV